MNNKDDFKIIDKLASAYGWSISYIQKLDIGEINGLIKAIEDREMEHYKLISYITALAMAGKTIDSVLSNRNKEQELINYQTEVLNQQQRDIAKQKQQEKELVRLFVRLGTSPEQITEGIKKGHLER